MEGVGLLMGSSMHDDWMKYLVTHARECRMSRLIVHRSIIKGSIARQGNKGGKEANA